MKVFITSSIKKYFNTYIEFIDYYWINFFKKYKIDYEVLPCDRNKIIKKFKNKRNIKSILILTGGSDVIGTKYDTRVRNLAESLLIKKSLKNRVPILGICRGAQLFCKLKGLASPILGIELATPITVHIFSNNFFLSNPIYSLLI